MKQVVLNSSIIEQKANTPNMIIKYINKKNLKENTLYFRQPIIEEMFDIFLNKKVA